MIHAIRAQSIQNQHQGGPIGSVGFGILVSIVLATIIALLVWVYRSITNVKRSALRFQAVLWLIMAFGSIHGAWPDLEFAFENLNPLFAILATLSVGMTMLTVPVGVAIALWGVTRSPEPSSFVATLDSRLAPNFWVYFNKLLDLPRTRCARNPPQWRTCSL